MKIALITGANKGIGLETARQLARDHGFTVLLGARDDERGEAAVDTLRGEGLDAQFVYIDPLNAASIEDAAREIREEFGHLDVLINNAGTMSEADHQAPSQVPVEALRETFELNVFALAEVTRAFWPLLNAAPAARLVNVSSQLGSLALNADFQSPGGQYKLLAYNSSKAAVNMMTLHYAWEWRDTPHRANAVHPGSVKTDLNPQGGLSLEEGAKTSVETATLPADGPNGTFSHLGETLPW